MDQSHTHHAVEHRLSRLAHPRAENNLRIGGKFVSRMEALHYTDGTSTVMKSQIFPDWFGGNNAVHAGFGRVKRMHATAAASLYFEGPPDNPRLYTLDFSLPRDKKLLSIGFQNVSPGENLQGNRAFIFAVSGLIPIPPVVTLPVEMPVTQPVVTQAVVTHPIVIKPAVPTTLHAVGKVLDIKTKKSVQAKLSFVMAPVVETTSDLNGIYATSIPAIGEYSVKIEAAGYISSLEKIKIVASPPDNEINFTLQPVELGTRVNLKNILFQQSTSQLLEESYAELNMVTDMMKSNSNMNIELAGHTDNRGSQELNLKLSIDRVNMVKKYLVEKGIDARRITGIRYGGSKLLSKDSSEETHKLNRRVEFVVTKF